MNALDFDWFFRDSQFPFSALDFGRLQEEDFIPLTETAIARSRKKIETIKSSSEKANFQNVIQALEEATEEVDFLAPVFNNLLGAHGTPQMQDLAKEILPKLSDFSSELFLDEKLFTRVKAVHDSPGNLGIEEREMLRRNYRAFVANGVDLPPDEKEKLKQMDRELTLLCQQFEENGLKATQVFFLELKNEKDWSGLPVHWIELAKKEAEKRKLPQGSAVVTLSYPSLIPFLQYADRRDLREKVWRASNQRGVGGEFDTREILKKIASLRHQRAQLLGYESHAQYVVEDRMAEKPETVRHFLDRMIDRSRPAAEREIAELKIFSGLGDDFKPWDSSYYSEKLRKQKLGFDDEELRPYFPLSAAFEGLKAVTHQLFGIEWKKLSGIPVYHPDVEVFEILDEKKSHLGLLYVDLFPRDEKRSGAWMTHFRDQGKFRGTIGRPHVSIVCSFTPASGDRPSLLTPNELNTLFHEAGHALHLLLSQTRHRSLAGTNVAWDFVELPSQLMENWASEPEAILTYARHYQTGEKPPESLLQKFKKSHQYEKGLFWIRQMQYAELDWGWHSENPDRFVSVEEMEKKVRPRVSVLPLVEGTLISPFFSHIFSGGYSAGYYSYAWADVLAADAFEAFEEEGLLNSETGRRLMREVLSKGGSEKPSKLYRNFRGHDPDPDSLFRRDGLI